MKKLITGICGLALIAPSLPLQAANKQWAAAPSNALWSTGGNWGGTAPVGGDFLIFGTSSVTTVNNDLTAATSYNGFNLGNGTSTSYTLNGNSVTLGGTLQVTGGTQTVNLALILSGNRSVTVASGASVFLNGVVSGGAGLIFDGVGTATFAGSAANTYTGATNVNLGSVILDFSNLAPTGGISSNLINGASALTLASSLTIKGNSAATATNQTFGNVTLTAGRAGSITLNPNGSTTTLTLGNTWARAAGSAANFDISAGGAIASVPTSVANNNVLGFATVKDSGGTGFASLSGGNIVRLTGQAVFDATSTSASTDYQLTAPGTTNLGTGTTTRTINSLAIDTTAGASTVDIGASSNVLALTSKGLLFTGANAATVQNGQLGAANTELILHTMGSGGVTISGTIGSGTASLTKNGGDTLTLTGANSYTGATNILGGSVVVGSSSALGVNSAVTLANAAGVNLDLNGFTTSLGSLAGGGALGGNVLLGTNTLNLGGNNLNTTFAGTFTGAGVVNKVGTGIQTLTGPNFASGSTVNILQGQITTSGTFGNAVVNLGDTSGSNSASFAVQSGNSNTINVRAGTTGTLTLLSGNNQAFNGPIVLGTGTTAQNVTWQSNGGGVAVLNSAVTGYGNFAILNNQNNTVLASTINGGTSFNNVGTVSNVSTGVGAGVVTMNGTLGANVTGLIQNSAPQGLVITTANANFIGDTTVTAGFVNLRNTNSLQKSVVNMNGGSLTFGTSTTVGLTTATLGGLAGSGNVVLADTLTSPAAVALTLGNSNASNGSVTNANTLNPVYSGALSGAGSVIKAGTNTQTLAGANTYTGTTTVNAGTLLISGSLAATNVTVNTGGSFGASGTSAAAAGTLTVASGGKLGAVNNAASVMTLSTAAVGGMNIAAAVGGANVGGLVFELGAVGASDQFVLSDLTGSLAIGSGVLNFDDFSFTTLSGFGAGVYTLIDTNATIVGSLGSSLSGSIGGLTGTLSSNGQDILLTVVPEPSTYALLGLGLASLFVLRRKARKTC